MKGLGINIWVLKNKDKNKNKNKGGRRGRGHRSVYDGWLGMVTLLLPTVTKATIDGMMVKTVVVWWMRGVGGGEVDGKGW